MLIETGVIKSASARYTDLDLPKSFTEQILEIESGVGKTGIPQWKEKPRKNMLLVRRRMRR